MMADAISANVSLPRRTLGARHLPVACDSLEGTVISSEWDVESDEVLASLDVIEFLLGNSRLFSG